MDIRGHFEAKNASWFHINVTSENQAKIIVLISVPSDCVVGAKISVQTANYMKMLIKQIAIWSLRPSLESICFISGHCQIKSLLQCKVHVHTIEQLLTEKGGLFSSMPVSQASDPCATAEQRKGIPCIRNHRQP